MNASDIPNWEKLPVADRLIYLRAFFLNGHVKKAKRHELEDYLLVLATVTGRDDPKQKEELERFRAVVQQLLEIRINEELNSRSLLLSWIAVGISILALLLTGWQALETHLERVDNQVLKSPPQKTVSSPSKQ